MSSQSLYDGLWERSIQRFPQLAAQFGKAPRDATGRPLLDAMIALRTLRLQAPAPQQPAPTPTPAPQQLVPTQQIKWGKGFFGIDVHDPKLVQVFVPFTAVIKSDCTPLTV